jgi:chromate transporter
VTVVLDLLVSFSKVGTLAWGGGPTMMAMMKAEVVERHRWMGDAEFADALAAGYALPGPIATKMAVYIGWHAGGTLGAAAALLGTVVPSLIMIIAVMLVYREVKDHPRVIGMMRALRPVVLAMVAWMVLDLAPESLGNWQGGVIAALALTAMLWLRVDPAWLLLTAGTFGALVYGRS